MRPPAGIITVAALAVALLGLFPAQPAVADERVELPFQLQFDLFGVSLGWHINELIFIGATHRPSMEARDLNRGRYDDRSEIYNQRGVSRAEFEMGKSNSIEVRFSPWEHGAYFAVGVLEVGGDTVDVLFDERQRLVGDGAYLTALRVIVRGKEATAPAVGFGINHVFDFGLSLAAGFLLGLTQPDEPDVVVQVLGPDSVPQSDIDKFKREVEDDFFDTPFLLHLAIGFNF